VQQRDEHEASETMRLRSPATLRALMDIQDVSVRRLAAAAGLSGHSMIQQLRDGSRISCRTQVAEGIAEALGTDTPSLFGPGRIKRAA
jgi:hypothetical protein